MPDPGTTQGLLHVIQRLSFARDLESVTTAVRQEVRALTGADGVTFVVRDGECCHYVAEDAVGPLWQGQRFPLVACISGWVMLRGETAVVPDIYADERIPHEAYRATFVRSLVMAPVRRDAPVAAIGVYWARPYLPTDEVATIETIANAAAVAMSNVRLNQELTEALERERRARLETEASSRLKDEFLATVSHELRTPLNVIQGWTWRLRQGDVPGPMRERAFDALQRNVLLQTRLVEDLLSASYASAGTLRLNLRRVDLTQICRTIPELIRSLVEAHDLRLDVEYGATPLITGDPERMQQIVWNLISNAIKFTPPGGVVTLSVAAAADAVVLCVRDTGVGIRPEIIEQVFEPFRQGESGTRRRFPGLGLGLHIVRLLVDLHGGRVSIESGGEGCGTTVTVEFPVNGAVSTPTSPETTTERPDGGQAPPFSRP